ncbi:MAG: TIR domain-containing protein [Lachnospiraceae bacterium]|nr:TIR domain-containing protein [Lachnospiraceae bacterium]
MSYGERQYKYDAFISYRHTEPDRTIAVKLQEMLEKYKAPQEIAARIGEKKLHFFRDEDELPTSSNLSAGIDEALEQSRYLICICSPEYLESRWCMQEITQFKMMHGGSNANIIPLVVKGDDPTKVFPAQLTHETRYFTDALGVTRSHEVAIEPLAGNVAAPDLKKSLKKLKTEALRIAAPLLGVGYNDLYDRDARRAARRRRTITAVVFASMALFLAYSSVMLIRIAKQNKELQYRNAAVLASEAEAALKADNRLLAAKSGLEAAKLYRSLGEPLPGSLVRSLADASFVYNYGRDEEIFLHRTVSLSAPGSFLAYFGDGTTLFAYDTANTFYIIDTMTNQILHRQTEDAVISDAYTEDMRVYIHTQSRLICFDASRLREVWSYEPDHLAREAMIEGMMNAASSPTILLVCNGFDGEEIYSVAVLLDKEDGSTIREQRVYNDEDYQAFNMTMFESGTCWLTFANKAEGRYEIGRFSKDKQLNLTQHPDWIGSLVNLSVSDAGVHVLTIGIQKDQPTLILETIPQEMKKSLWLETIPVASRRYRHAGIWSGTVPGYGEVVAVTYENRVMFRNARTGELMADYTMPETITGFAEQRGDRVLFYGANAIYSLVPEADDLIAYEDLLEEMTTIRFGEEAYKAAVAGDGAYAYISRTEPVIQCYVSVSSENIRRIDEPGTRLSEIHLVVTSPDGYYGAMLGRAQGAEEDTCTLLIFDTESGEVCGKTVLPNCKAVACTFTDRGNLMLAYSNPREEGRDAYVKLFDTGAYEIDAAYVPGGLYYANASDPKSLFDNIVGYDRTASASGGYITLGAAGFTLWDDGEIACQEGDDYINCFACSTSGTYVTASWGDAINDYRATVRYGTDPKKGRKLHTVTENGKALSYEDTDPWFNVFPDVTISEDGGRIAFIDAYLGRICVAETEGEDAGEIREIPFYGEAYTPQKIQFTKDGSLLLVLTGNGWLLKYDAVDGKLLDRMDLGEGPHTGFRYAGREVFCELPDGSFLIWLATKTLHVRLTGMDIYGSFEKTAGYLPAERTLYAFDGVSLVSLNIMDEEEIIRGAEFLLEDIPDQSRTDDEEGGGE